MTQSRGSQSMLGGRGVWSFRRSPRSNYLHNTPLSGARGIFQMLNDHAITTAGIQKQTGESDDCCLSQTLKRFAKL